MLKRSWKPFFLYCSQRLISSATTNRNNLKLLFTAFLLFVHFPLLSVIFSVILWISGSFYLSMSESHLLKGQYGFLFRMVVFVGLQFLSHNFSLLVSNVIRMKTKGNTKDSITPHHPRWISFRKPDTRLYGSPSMPFRQSHSHTCEDSKI